MEGIYPPFNSKGAYLVVADMLAFMANSVISTRSTQSFWLCLTIEQNICPTLRLVHSVCQSVWGWNEVDIRSFAPNILCNSPHHLDVNLESLSLTIELGSP